MCLKEGVGTFPVISGTTKASISMENSGSTNDKIIHTAILVDPARHSSLRALISFNKFCILSETKESSAQGSINALIWRDITFLTIVTKRWTTLCCSAELWYVLIFRNNG